MKCKYCNADVKGDTNICPYCGNPIEVQKILRCPQCDTELAEGFEFCPSCGSPIVASQSKKCNQCGADLEEDGKFCPNCGAPVVGYPDSFQMSDSILQSQPQEKVEEFNNPVSEEIPVSEHNHDDLANTLEPDESGGGSKKWLWILGAILLLGLVGGGWYLFNEGFFGNRAMGPVEEIVDSIAEVNDSICEEKYDIHSIDGIKQRLSEILTDALKMPEEDAINTFFSEEFRDLYAKVEKYDMEHPENEIGFWNGNIWNGGQDGAPNGFTISSVSSSTETEAYADVKFSHDIDEYHSATYQSVSLVFENGNWYIDDVNGDKTGMKEYVSQSANETTYNGTFSLVGHVSQDIIHMKIDIDNTSVKGHYYYDSRGSSNQVRLEGMVDVNGNMKLTMYGNDGEAKGYFSGTFDGSTYSGQFVHNSIEENLPFSVSKE